MPRGAVYAYCCATRAISPARHPRLPASSCMAGRAISSTASSGSCGGLWRKPRAPRGAGPHAVGPWLLVVAGEAGVWAHQARRLVRGSHVVVPRLYEGEQAYLLKNNGGWIVFVTPFDRPFSLIGTTGFPSPGDPATAEITEEE